MKMASLRLKHVNAFANWSRKNSRLRYYFRCRGQKAIPLPGLPGSEEFMAAYAAALAGIESATVEIGASRTQPGTIDALCVSYYRSDAWTRLTEDTREGRYRVIERWRAAHGSKRVALLQREHIEKMLAKLGTTSAKRLWLASIRGLLQAAIPTLRKDDPTAGIAVKLPKGKGHHTWTDDEIEQYRAHWPLGTQQRLVMEFALETVSRRSEIVRLGPQHVKNGRVRIERTHGSADVDILVSDALQAAIDAMPRKHLTFIHTAAGKPRSKEGLTLDFAEWATAAGLPSRCRMHGLKKGGMRRLAEDGYTTHELMGTSGHKTLSEVQRYTDAADKKRLADSGHAKRRRSA
jgi:integrase